VPFSDCLSSCFVGGQPKVFRISEIGRFGIELRNERGGVGFKLRLSIEIPIEAMTVVAHALPVKDGSSSLSISLRFCALVR
jgi:hypothetical protein